MIIGISLAKSEPTVVKYSLNFFSIDCLSCVKLPLTKNSWLHEVMLSSCV